MVTGEAPWLDSVDALDEPDSLDVSLPVEDELLDPSELVAGVLAVEVAGVVVVVDVATFRVTAGVLVAVVAVLRDSAGSCPEASWT